MRPLSATEAVSPAIERAKSILRPYSVGLWIKIGLVGLLAELSSQLPFPPMGGGAGAHQPTHTGTTTITPQIGILAGVITLGVIVVLGIIFFIVGLVILYFGSRMQLVLMDLVATRTTLVAPAWQRTAPRTWRWIGLKLLTFLIAGLVLGLFIGIPAVLLFTRISSRGGNPTTPQGPVFGVFALFFLVVLVAAFLVLAVVWFIRDFVLPFILFDDARIGDAFREAMEIFRDDPGSVSFYLFMKFVIMILFGIAGELAIALCAGIAAIPLGIVGAAAYFALRNAGSGGKALMFVTFGLLGFIFFAVLVVLVLSLCAALFTFYQAYSLYFLGGRYPRLGAILEPPPPAEYYPQQFVPPPPDLPPAPA
jgi:hypothetical protein